MSTPEKFKQWNEARAKKIAIKEFQGLSEKSPEEILAQDEALISLENFDERKARIVELHWILIDAMEKVVGGSGVGSVGAAGLLSPLHSTATKHAIKTVEKSILIFMMIRLWWIVLRLP